MRRQHAIKGHPRIKLAASAEDRLWAWVRREAERNDCSQSLVIVSALSYASGIPLDGGKRKPRRGWRVR